MKQVFPYIGAVSVILWGVAHIIFVAAAAFISIAAVL